MSAKEEIISTTNVINELKNRVNKIECTSDSCAKDLIKLSDDVSTIKDKLCLMELDQFKKENPNGYAILLERRFNGNVNLVVRFIEKNGLSRNCIKDSVIIDIDKGSETDAVIEEFTNSDEYNTICLCFFKRYKKCVSARRLYFKLYTNTFNIEQLRNPIEDFVNNYEFMKSVGFDVGRRVIEKIGSKYFDSEITSNYSGTLIRRNYYKIEDLTHSQY